jgi:hypothetical protein
MARYVWLLAGRPLALDRPAQQRWSHVVAACTDTVPLMWLPMFGLADMSYQSPAMGDATTRIRLRADKVQAIASLKQNYRHLVASPKADQSLACMADLLGKAVLAAPGPLVEADLTEMALADDLDAFVLGLAAFLEWLRAAQPESTDWLPPKQAAQFVRDNCKLCEKALPTDAELQHPENMSSEMMSVTGHLLGSSWERPVPWEAR